MPGPAYSGYAPTLDFSAETDVQRVLIATGDYATLAPVINEPSLLHLILPERVNFVAKSDHDFGSQQRFKWTSAQIAKAAADATFNRDVWNFTLDGGNNSTNDLAFDPGTVKASYSMVFALNYVAATVTKDSYLFSQRSDSLALSGALAWFSLSGNVITFQPNGSPGLSNAFARALLPAAGTPFILGLDYNGSTTSNWWLNDPTAAVATQANHVGAPVVDATYYWRFFNLFGNSNRAWGGKAGTHMIFDGVWSPLLRQQAFTFLKSYYGIA